MQIDIRPLDLIVISLYLLAMAGVGIWFSRRNKSTEEYFVGGRSFPGWAIGLSMLGTSISSITFLAFPATAYKGDWRELVANLMLPVVAVLAIVVFIPFFRRGQLTSAFEYLEDRFGPTARLYGTASFVLLQLIRIANILVLVSIPVSLLTGIERGVVIVVVGVFIAFYTVAGGFDAVIWTDVVQSIVLWFGGLLCFGYIAWNLPEGVSQIFAIGAAHDKFHLGPSQFNIGDESFWGEKTIWTVALIGVFNWLAMYSSDQNVVQRYVATKSLRDARWAAGFYTLVAVPTWAFFFFVGTCVFVWYQVYPDVEVAQYRDAESVLPHFILTQLPAGLAGLTIAGVMAAAMSSLDSSINAIATVSTVDLLKPYLARGRSDQFYLKAARWIATATAAIMIGGAVFISRIEKESMNDLNWIVGSVFGGCLVGLFMVGFFTRRVDAFSALTGLIVAILFNVYLGAGLAGWLSETWTLPVHSYWVGILVNLTFVGIAYATSLFRGPPQELKGLTVWSIERKTSQNDDLQSESNTG